jgi:phospholipase/carboxylesterase
MNSRILSAGAPLHKAKAAVIMLHGRGASAQSMLAFANSFDAADFAFLAPQACGSTWYPFYFLAPLRENEPALSNALATVGNIVAQVTDSGLAPESQVLLGFSQGGCLALEYGARHARRYAGLIGLSAGLIGPAGTPRDYTGSFAKTPIFIGCSDTDFHIPLARVKESSSILRALDGDVTERIYPGLGHTINTDEIDHIKRMLATLVRPSASRAAP